MASRNPFTPTFGMVPPFLFGHDRVLVEVARARSQTGCHGRTRRRHARF